MTDPGFSCVRCLHATATLTMRGDDGQEEPWCDACLDAFVTDHLLDLVNDGELRVSGHAFETTELYAARREYERGEG